MFKVLHFDDDFVPSRKSGGRYSFADKLKARLIRKFAGKPFEIESITIANDDDFHHLRDRIRKWTSSEDTADLVLIDLRLDLKAAGKYREPSEMEGLEIAKLLYEIDPGAEFIKRAFLTRTLNKITVTEMECDVDALNVDFLSKDILPVDGKLWTRSEPFPNNVELYIDNIAKNNGAWS